MRSEGYSTWWSVCRRLLWQYTNARVCTSLYNSITNNYCVIISHSMLEHNSLPTQSQVASARERQQHYGEGFAQLLWSKAYSEVFVWRGRRWRYITITTSHVISHMTLWL